MGVSQLPWKNKPSMSRVVGRANTAASQHLPCDSFSSSFSIRSGAHSVLTNPGIAWIVWTQTPFKYAHGASDHVSRVWTSGTKSRKSVTALQDSASHPNGNGMKYIHCVLHQFSCRSAWTNCLCVSPVVMHGCTSFCFISYWISDHSDPALKALAVVKLAALRSKRPQRFPSPFTPPGRHGQPPPFAPGPRLG